MLTETVGQRQLVVIACDIAASRGVRAGMALAEAQALCGAGLQHAGHDPQRDQRALEALACWMTLHFSPHVAAAPPDGLLLDVTGSERLFGGMDRLLDQVRQALSRLRIAAGACVAPTPGAAWAMAFAGHDRMIVSEPARLADVLAPLPVETLRIESEAAITLRHLGIDTIGRLMALPRDALPARFGSTLLLRLDEAMGRIDEPIVPVRIDPAVAEAMEFDGAVTSPEALWEALRQVLRCITGELRRRGRGARRIEIELARPYAPPVHKTILLARPTRDERAMFKLLECALEDRELAQAGGNDGFTAVRIGVPASEILSESQIALLEHEEQAGLEQLDRLIERLHARLGDGAVLRPALVESYVPERAFRCLDPLSRSATHTPCQAPRRGDEALPTRAGLPLFPPKKRLEPASRLKRPMLRGDRPLNLLFHPIEVGVIVSPSAEGDGPPLSFTLAQRVHRLLHATGPERIAGRWWDGHLKTRDYFEAEDAATGMRYWLFRVRETGKWYVQGVFD